MARLCFAVFALTLVASPLFAQPLAAHSGTYVWSGADAERTAIAAAIEAAVADMNTFSQNVARMRLLVANQPVERLNVTIDADATTLVAGENETSVPATGTARVRGPGGERARASQSVEGRTIHLVFRSPRGTRHQTMHFEGDQMILEVRIESPHLTAPVTYRLTYNRS